MGLFDSLFRLNIEWSDDSRNTMVYKYPFKNGGREVTDKSSLTVRESQVAIFVYKGQIADVFTPGIYKLNTDILPILTSLAAWTYAFQTPITLDVYFVNTKQFTNIKWGTQNPFIMRDPDFGVIRVRGFGSFSFRVDDAPTFMKELFGTGKSYATDDIQEFLKTMVVTGLTDAVGESKVSVLDLAGNTMEFQTIVKAKVQELFKNIGLKLETLLIENMSVPEEVQKALDERTKYGIMADSTDTMMKVAAAEAMRDAAKNPGMGGAFMGAGVGMGAGMGIGGIMAGAIGGAAAGGSGSGTAAASSGSTAGKTVVCPGCGHTVSAGKFCPECGARLPEKKFCTDCGAEVPAGSKFCPGCGKRIS